MPDKWVERIFMKLSGIYGHKFVSLFADDEMFNSSKHEWGLGLTGLTGKAIERGFAKLIVRNEEWPPSLPEFRRLCQVQAGDLGLPSVDDTYSVILTAMNGTRYAEESYLEYNRRKFKHPFYFLVWNHLDTFQLRRMNYREVKTQVKQAHKQTIDKIMTGKLSVEWPAAEIEQQDKFKEDNSKQTMSASDALATMRQVLR